MRDCAQLRGQQTVWGIMRSAMILPLLLLVGCESMPRGEFYYQTAHAIDVLQTMASAADDPCYVESDPITRALIGKNPSRGEVLAWGVGLGAAHYGVSRYLENNAPPWVLTAWQVVTTGYVIDGVRSNYQLGVRIFSENDHSKIGGC